MVTKIREEKQITMSYEAWITSNVLEIDRAFNRASFALAHLAICTLYMNLLARDRKGLIEFIGEHPEDYDGLSPAEAEDFLKPDTGTYWENLITSEWKRDTWKYIYMAMIDFFASKGYLFRTREIEIGDDRGVGVEPADIEST